jgi:hypothetical protein
MSLAYRGWLAGPITVRELVTVNLGLNGCGHRPADPRDHDETAMTIRLGATERLVWRHDPVHRVAIVLDLRHGALLHGQSALVGMLVDGRWRNDRLDWGLRCVHGHALRPHGTATLESARVRSIDRFAFTCPPEGRRISSLHAPDKTAAISQSERYLVMRAPATVEHRCNMRAIGINNRLGVRVSGQSRLVLDTSKKLQSRLAVSLGVPRIGSQSAVREARNVGAGAAALALPRKYP